MSVLYTTTGIAGCGKSSFTNYIKEVINAVEVNADNIRAEFGDINDQSKNKEVFEEVDKRIVQHLAGGHNVILSNTNLYYFSLVNYAKKFPYNDIISFIMLDSCNPDLCKERIKKDLENHINRSNVPMEVIDRQYKNFKYFMEDVEKKNWLPNMSFYTVDEKFGIKKI